MADITAPHTPESKRPRKQRPESVKAEQAFLTLLDAENVTLLEDGYLGGKTPHRVRCARGHLTTPRPGNVIRRQSVCGTCRALAARRQRSDAVAAEATFRAAVEAQGAQLISPYRGRKKRHEVVCQAGHWCTPLAERVIDGGSVCRICSGRDPEAAWRNFRDRVEELDGTVVDPSWKGSGTPHEIRCKKGHTSYPYPNRVAQGVGICRVCAGSDPEMSERVFRERIERAGATALDPYQSAHKRLRLRCSSGHTFTATPHKVARSKCVLCPLCGGRTPGALLSAHKARVEAQGGICLANRWLGAQAPHDAICREGHLCSPRPSGVKNGKNICRICACRDPHVIEERFRERVAELGGVVLGPWETIHVPVLVRCKKGHKTSPIPNHVIRGGGLCRHCAGKSWDVFYVVHDDDFDVVKFGITSGDPRPRLSVHARDGFDRVVRLLEGLPGDTAPVLERTILAALRDAREKPARGREYFPTRVLPLVLDLVDNHPALR